MADVICDFCGEPGPVWMYANPLITSAVSRSLFLAGHFGACKPCGLLLESGKIAELADRALTSKFHGAPDISPAQMAIMRVELYDIFSKVSRQRERMAPPGEYGNQA